ncbi:uncharacterized protein ACNS7B_013472 [Menidia menidia]
MKNLLLFSAALMAVAITAQSLTCYTCRVGFAGKCLFRSTETCSDSQASCYYGQLSFNISRLMSLETRGCISPLLCNNTESGTLLTAGYTVTRSCCSTDLCNGAPSARLAGTAAVGAMLTAVWSQLVI